MKLEIKSCREQELSSKCSDVLKVIISNDYYEVAKFLNNTYYDDFYEVEDLSYWMEVLEKLDEILNNILPDICSCDQLDASNKNVQSKFIVCNILKFLCLLLKSSKDKRYFLSLQTIRNFMRSTDRDIAILAIEVLFNICIPSSSISNSLNDDWIDSFEIPDDIARDALNVYEGLSLLSTDEFGLKDYLHGHQPSFLNMHCHKASISIKFPPRNDGEAAINLCLNASDWDMEADSTILDGKLLQLKITHNLSIEEFWTVLNILNTLHGFQSTMEYRLSIVKTRLRCFFLLVHSKISPELIQDYIRLGSPFIQDLVELADITSEAMSELNLQNPILLAYVALEAVLGLLENKLRRRSSFVVQSNILQLLGLVRASGIDPQVNSHRGAQGDVWSSIVLSACAAASTLYEQQFTLSSLQNSQLTENTLSSVQNNAMNDQIISSTGKFIRIGLELFALSLTTRESSNVINDIPTIGAIVGLIQGAVPHLSRLLEKISTQGSSYKPCAYDVHVLLVTAKAFYCLELTIDRNEYISAFRECDGISVVAHVIELFSKVDIDPNTAIVLDNTSRNLLESVLSVLVVSLQKSRHHQAMMIQSNASDTGQRIVAESYFTSFACKIFRSPYHQNELIWSQVIAIFKEVIDTDASYLNIFINTACAEALVNAVSINSNGGTFPTMFTEKNSDLEIILLPLSRLVLMLCITVEGKAFIRKSRVLHFIIEAIVQPINLLPRSLGIYGDKLSKIGKVFSQIMIDFEEIKPEVKELLKKKIILYCKEAQSIWKAMSIREHPSLDSSRIQTLQKLTNVCTIVESMCNENRSNNSELIRDLMSEPVAEALIGAYSCTLPPSKQLFAQLSLRHNATFPHYGHSASAKAISSLLKLAAARVSQCATILVSLCKEIDEKLNIIGSTKQALRAYQVNASGEGNLKEVKEVIASQSMLKASYYEDEDQYPISKSRRRSRGGSLGNSTNVLVLGILDCFPNKCVIDPDFYDELNKYGPQSDVEKLSWQFLTSVLSLEWLSIMMSTAMRTDQRNPSSKAMTANKDTLRRIFAFHRSSMLEVCRFAAHKSALKSCDSNKIRKGLLDSFCQCDSSEDIDFIPRIPVVYHLQVAGSGGALVREGIELEGSRVVLIAEVGSRIDAFERRLNSAGIMRYRTTHGWISEFRRDHQRSPIVELIEMPVLSSSVIQEQLLENNKNKEDVLKKENKNLSELFTFREAASFCMSRAHGSLRQVAIYLSRSMYSPDPSGLRAPVIPPSATALSISLSKIIKGFLTHPSSCLDDSSPPVAKLMKELKELQSSAQTNAIPSKAIDSNVTPLKTKRNFKNEKSLLSHSSNPLKAEGNRSPLVNAISILDKDDTKEVSQESTSIDLSTLCLYYGSTIKHMIMPVMEDKNGSFNLLLLRTFCNQGVISFVMDGLQIVMLVIKEAISELNPSVSLSNSDSLLNELNHTGKCALHALPSILALFRRLASRDLLNKSIASSISSPNISLADEYGQYQTYELLFSLLHNIYKYTVPLIHKKVLIKFPADVQSEWLYLICDIVSNLVTPMPAPKETSANNKASHSSEPRQGIRSIFGTTDSQAQTPLTMDDRQSIRSSRRMNIAYTGGLGYDMSFNRNNIQDHSSSPNYTPNNVSSSSSSIPERQNPQVDPGSSAPSTEFSIDSSVMELLVEMGFERTSITSAMNTLQSNSLDQVTEYLINHIHLVSAAITNSTTGVTSPLVNESNADVLAVPAPPTVVSNVIPPVPPPIVNNQDHLINGVPEASQFDSLPNLVNDLDTSDDTCENNSTVETTSALVAPGESSVVTISESLSPEELRLNHQLSIERFREDISLLFDQSLQPPVQLPLNRPSETSMNIHSSTNESSSTSLPPEVFTRILEDDDVVEINDTEFEKCSKSLLLYAQEMCFAIIPNILEACINFEFICKWDAKEPTHYFMSILISLIVKLNHSLGLANKSNDNCILYVKIYKEIITNLKQTLEQSSSQSFYGFISFLTQLLQEPSILKQLVDSKEFNRDDCIDLTEILISLISKELSTSILKWPQWISSSFILLNQLLNIVPEKNNMNLAIGKYLWSDMSPIISSLPTATSELGSLNDKTNLSTNDSSFMISQHSNESSMYLVDTVYLLPRKSRLAIFDMVLDTIDLCFESDSSNVDVIISTECVIGLYLVLSNLLIEHVLVEKFVNRNGVILLLKLSNKSKGTIDEKKNEFKIISQILRKCMETEIEMQQQMFLQIQDLFKSNSTESNKKYISLNSFLKGLSIFTIRSTSDFIYICKRCVKFIKVIAKDKINAKASIDSNNEIKYEIQVKLLDKDQLPEFSLNSFDKSGPDSRSYKTFQSVVAFLVSEVKSFKIISITDGNIILESLIMKYLQISGILEALADAVLILKRVPFLVGKLIKYENEGINLTNNNNENLIDFLLNNYFGEKIDDNLKSTNLLPSVSRFLISLCAFQGNSRIIVLNSIVKALRNASISVYSNAEIMNSNMIQNEEKRVLILSRLSALILIIIRVSKTLQKETLGVDPIKGQGVCVETIYYLIENVGILKLLTNALVSLRVSLSLSNEAICSIMEIIELITRPKLQSYLDAAATTAENAKHVTTQEVISSDDFIDMTLEDNIRRFDYMDLHGQSNATTTNQNNMIHLDQNTDDDDARNPDEEEEEDESEDDEDESEYDEDEVEENDDEEEDENDDDEEEDEDIDFINQSMNITLDAGHDSYINVDNILNSNDRNNRNNHTESMMESFEQARMAMEHGLEIRDMNLPSNSFVTPPDRLTQDLTQLLISGIDNHDSSSGFIANMVRRVRNGFGNASLSDNYTMLPGEGGDTNGAGLTELLPQGISSALEVNQTNISHPLLSRQGVFTNTYSGPSVVDTTPAGLQSFMSRASGAGGFGSAAVAGFTNGFRRPIITGPANGNGTRTVIHFSSTGAWADSRLPSSTDIPGLGGLLDLPQFDDIDSSLSAVWPRQNALSSSNNPLQSQNITSGGLLNQEAERNFFTQTLQQYIENNLISGLEFEEEIPDEFSQVSFAEQSREDGGYSISTQSNLALHDPNSRGNHGETDSRNDNQDPIPPHIEIHNRDHDANEDMSVITLPPEDANQHLDDDMSVNTQLSVIAEEVSLLLFQQQSSQAQESSVFNNDVDPLIFEENERIHVNEEFNPITVNIASTIDNILDVNSINNISFDASLFQFPATSLTAVSTSDSTALDNIATTSQDESNQALEYINQGEIATQLSLNNNDVLILNEDTGSSQQITCPSGYDSAIFYSLPLDMQLEIAEQHSNTNDQMLELIESSGLDYNTIMALPEDIRNEVLDQARMEQASNRLATGNESGTSIGAQEIDNASFLASLTLELRSEVLLTAEPEFLATLPPDLVAEAQMLRERAASTWQRRELMSRMGTREGNNFPGNSAQRSVTAEANSGIGAPDEFRDENDDDEDDMDEDDDDIDRDDIEMHRHRARPSSRSTNEDNKPKLGLMRLPLSEKPIMKLPNTLILCMIKVILHAPKQTAKCNALLFRILQNISNDLKMKDINLRLLISLVSGKRDLLLNSVEDLTPGQGSNNLDMLTEKKCDIYQKDPTVYKPKLYSKGFDQVNLNIEVSSVASQRIISILSHFVEGNSAFIYLFLAERNPNLIFSNELIHEIERKAILETSPLPELSTEIEKKIPNSTSYTENNIAILKGPAKDNSTNSLLELLISLFAKPLLCNNISDLSALTNLLSQVTSPLDSIDENAINQNDDGSIGMISIEQKNKDIKNKMISIKVPKVVTSKDSLQILCDALLNDLCSKNILNNISNVISRLSKIPTNHSLLIELISDSIIDLAEQSNSKLQNLVENLVASKANYEKLKESKDFQHMYTTNNTTKMNDSIPKNTNTAVIATATTTTTTTGGTTTLPTSLIPLGEAGGRQHERLLRVIHTLYSMAMKTNRSLYDVAPLEHLMQLWNNIDIVLYQLKLYLVEDEEVEKSESDNIETKKPQSTLTSILNRLLPAIEVFFLVYTSDLLTSKSEISGDIKNKSSLTRVAHVHSHVKAVESSSTIEHSVVIPGELIPASSMPGHSYRTSRAYLSNNLSLFVETSTDEHISLQNSYSFRKQMSYPQMNQTISKSSTTTTTTTTVTSRTQKLLHFVQAHKGLLNLIIKAQPTLLNDSFASLVKITQLRVCLKFENKRKYFFTQLKKTESSSSRRSLHLQIRRNQVFEDSFHQLRGRTAEEMKNRLQVSFYGEEGVDAGGLSREWFMILSREIFNPGYALFISTVDGATFQPSPNSAINTNHLEYFKFIGRIIGKAICDGQLMDAHFTRSFYKHVLGMPVDFNDIESTEPDYYKILKQIIDTPLDLLMMDLTFSAEIQKFGRTEIVDLIPDGRNILVTDDNKYDYIRLIAHHRMTAAIRAQTDSFLQGFYDLVPAELICIFSPTELELLICGLPEVNIEELQLNTDYHQYKATDDVIIWFWDTLKNFNREEKAAFLQFVTGTSKVPLGGFANLQGMRGNQRFSIHKSYGDNGLLPSAHTCFNQLDLPAYSNAETLKEKLLLAISEGMEGFGFA